MHLEHEEISWMIILPDGILRDADNLQTSRIS